MNTSGSKGNSTLYRHESRGNSEKIFRFFSKSATDGWDALPKDMMLVKTIHKFKELQWVRNICWNVTETPSYNTQLYLSHLPSMWWLSGSMLGSHLLCQDNVGLNPHATNWDFSVTAEYLPAPQQAGT